MKTGAKPSRVEPPEELRARIEAFVRGCREPALLEPGEKIIPLDPARFGLTIRGPAVVLEAWSEAASLARRVLRVVREDPERTRLELAIHRLGRGEGSLTLLDLARAGSHIGVQAGRLEFRERFRRLLERQCRGWQVTQLSAAADLEHSLSPAYARALLTRGSAAFAAIGADEAAGAATCDQILSFGLIWLDYLRQREARRTVQGLKIFLPLKRAAATANRLAFLDASLASYDLYEFGPDNSMAPVDPANYGNLATTLEPALPVSDPAPPIDGWIEGLIERFGAERVARGDGLVSLRLRGLEFACASTHTMTYGLNQDHAVTPANFRRVEELAARIAAARSVEAPDKQDPLYRAAPERWLESVARCSLGVLDPTLRPPLYSQVPAMAGADRGILDLVAADRLGRLVILELKASEDLHLPLQGLDYWMRVKWHLDRGEFPARGYFPGLELRAEPPRLLLVSPVFDFHPTTETILRYFSAQVEVERVGLGMSWRSRLEVVFRARGAERPG